MKCKQPDAVDSMTISSGAILARYLALNGPADGTVKSETSIHPLRGADRFENLSCPPPAPRGGGGGGTFYFRFSLTVVDHVIIFSARSRERSIF
jgi:hypothetical protein